MRRGGEGAERGRLWAGGALDCLLLLQGDCWAEIGSSQPRSSDLPHAAAPTAGAAVTATRAAPAGSWQGGNHGWMQVLGGTNSNMPTVGWPGTAAGKRTKEIEARSKTCVECRCPGCLILSSLKVSNVLSIHSLWHRVLKVSLVQNVSFMIRSQPVLLYLEPHVQVSVKSTRVREGERTHVAVSRGSECRTTRSRCPPTNSARRPRSSPLIVSRPVPGINSVEFISAPLSGTSASPRTT